MGVGQLRPVMAVVAAAVFGCATVAQSPARGAVLGARAAPPACAIWQPPVDGPVVEPFRAPTTRYGPGHRGVDFAAPSGTPVRAAADGVVAFAGSVAGSLHVVLAHERRLRTTYAFLGRVDVRAGEGIRRGQVVGAAGGRGPGHEPGVVHFGVRLADEYVDPAPLFRVCDLTELVHLIPVDLPPGRPWDTRAGSSGTGRGPSVEHAGPRGGIGSHFTDVAADVAGAFGAAWDAAFSGASAAGTLAWSVGDALVAGGAAIARAGVDTARHTPGGDALAALGDVGRRTLDWLRGRTDCSDPSPPADGTGGSGHLLLAVAGIDSQTDEHSGRTFDLDTRALGYQREEVTYYSYARDGGRYTPEATWGDLKEAGRRLGEQLKQMQHDHPGREVDLIAHSQGGVVVDVFLQYFYDAADPAYPPIGTVVTLAAPHRGAPLATAARDIAENPVGRVAVEGLDRLAPVPAHDSPAVRQLDERSRLVHDLWRHHLPDHIDFTTIGGNSDPVVPATQIEVPGATEVVVDVGRASPHDDHTAIVTDDRALQVVRSALEGKALPCVGVLEGLRGAAIPVVITRFEHALGRAGGVRP